MRKITKKITKAIFVLLVVLLNNIAAQAQWCVVNTALPYSANMPGISNVTVNTINRSSLTLENFPYNSYVNTGMSTELITGQTYSMSITHNVDASICPDMNLRVWIDYNHDFVLDDPGETVISTDHHLPGTFTGNFTVPATVTLGSTRMRVTAKMSDLGGHILPTPCDNPADLFGYHGEIEDYDVVLASSVGINQLASPQSNFVLYPNPSATDVTVNFNLEKASAMALDIYNAIGKRIYSVPPKIKAAGSHTMTLKLSDLNINEGGVYFIEMVSGDKRSVQRFIKF